MQLEVLFMGNIAIIFAITLFYIFTNNNFEIDKKMAISYLFAFLIKLGGILSIYWILIIYFLVSFIYFEFFTSDKMKDKLLISVKYKIIDYFYNVLIIYNFFPFLVILSLTSNRLGQYLKTNFIYKIDIDSLLLVIAFVLLIILINKTISLMYKVETFDNIFNKMIGIKKITELKIDEELLTFFQILCNFEDKSYFLRENQYNLLCWNFIKYKYYNNQQVIGGTGGIIGNPFRKIFNWMKSRINQMKKMIIIFYSILKFIIKKRRNLLSTLRGYSCLEMQLIRTLGISEGYSQHKIRRKIYEYVYSTIYFKSFRKNLIRLSISDKYYKEYLLYIYFYVAPIFVKNRQYKNILELWNKNRIEDCSVEEIFVGVLGLSNKRLDTTIMNNYSHVIQNYKMDKEKLLKKIEYITMIE